MTLILFKYLVRNLSKRTQPQRGKLSLLHPVASREIEFSSLQRGGIVFAHVVPHAKKYVATGNRFEFDK